MGGGEALAKFLLAQKSKLTITDLRKRKILEPVIKRLGNNKIEFVLGKHREADFKKNDIIVFNPAVSIFSRWAKLAKRYKKPIENDLTLFLKILKTKNPNADYIAVTGTRGKTTTSFWINHFLEKSVLGGNIPGKGFFTILENKEWPFVLELSSFELEFLKRSAKPPKVAVIMNLYNDHLNRYGNFNKYLEQKAKIFLNQTKNDYLILNADNEYTKEFLEKKPKPKIYYLSLKKLPANKRGLYFIGNKIYFNNDSQKKLVHEIKNLASHQKYNLLAALLGAHLYGKPWKELIKKIKSLPQPSFRQELVFKGKNLEIINDSASTSPDATIAALERFGGKDELTLITGGADKCLDFSGLAKKIKTCVKPENLLLLEGNATLKLINELNKNNYCKPKDIRIFNSLNAILTGVAKESHWGTVIFSPAAASFEKFKNEFDRGRQFNKIINRVFNQEHGKIKRSPLENAYLKIHEKESEGLEDWEIAKQIVEVLDDPNWIDPDLAKECLYSIVHEISYPDEETKKSVILMAEEKARNVFPELSEIDEVHMDQIEYAYNKWRQEKQAQNK